MISRRHIFETAFPFYVLLSSDLKVVGLGRSLLKLGFVFGTDTELKDLFNIQRPPIEPDYSPIVEHASTVFYLESRDKSIVLKGQMLEVGYHGETELVFLGSPVFQSLDDIEEMGLGLSDFALHDNALDYLVFMQVQESVHNDTKRLAEKLLEETRARRKAQEVLEQANLTLESKVQERTEELSQANNKLKGFVEKLHASNMDLRVLNDVDEVLHSCQTVQDAFPTVVKAIQQLFPDSSGHISCYDDELEHFKAGVKWGDAEHRLGDTFTHEECSAIAGETSFHGYGPNKAVTCSELQNMNDEHYFCRPLRIGSETLGLLHFQYGMDASYEDQEEWRQSRKNLAATLAEHMAMGLSNIRLRQKLAEDAVRDPLTRQFNRRYMENVLEQEMARAKRNEGKSFAVVLLDVDHFKVFNDTHGHQAGDHVLIQLGGLLASQTRKGDVVCRYGGEEFLLILTNASMGNALKRAESIRAAVERLCIEYEGSSLGPITISAGVTDLRSGDDGIDSIIRRADDALYRAKESGRNKVVEG